MINKDNELYDALVAAFSLMAYADQEIHPAKLSKFLLSFEQAHPFIAKGNTLQRDAETYINALKSNYDQGMKAALSRIEKFRGDMISGEKIMAAAQTVVVSDHKISQSEEALIGVLCETLDLPKNKYCIDV